MCPSSQRPQCVFQVEVPAATPLTVLPTLLTTRPRQVGTGVELAAKRYGADPRYQARALPRSLPSSCPAPTRHAPVFVSSRAYHSHALTPSMYQAYLDATPLLFPTLASLRRTFSRG